MHPLHVDRDPASDRDAVVTCAPGEMGRIGAGDHRLCGHATGVDAGSADELAFDQRDLHAGRSQAPGERGSRLPGADDNRVPRANPSGFNFYKHLARAWIGSNDLFELHDVGRSKFVHAPGQH